MTLDRERDTKWRYSFNLSNIILTRERGCCCMLLHQSVILRNALKSISKWCHYFHPGKRRIVLRWYYWTIHLSSSPQAVPCKHLNNTKATQGKLWRETMLFYSMMCALNLCSHSACPSWGLVSVFLCCE